MKFRHVVQVEVVGADVSFASWARLNLLVLAIYNGMSFRVWVFILILQKQDETIVVEYEYEFEFEKLIPVCKNWYGLSLGMSFSSLSWYNKIMLLYLKLKPKLILIPNSYIKLLLQQKYEYEFELLKYPFKTQTHTQKH